VCLPCACVAAVRCVCSTTTIPCWVYHHHLCLPPSATTGLSVLYYQLLMWMLHRISSLRSISHRAALSASPAGHRGGGGGGRAVHPGAGGGGERGQGAAGGGAAGAHILHTLYTHTQAQTRRATAAALHRAMCALMAPFSLLLQPCYSFSLTVL